MRSSSGFVYHKKVLSLISGTLPHFGSGRLVDTRFIPPLFKSGCCRRSFAQMMRRQSPSAIFVLEKHEGTGHDADRYHIVESAYTISNDVVKRSGHGEMEKIYRHCTRRSIAREPVADVDPVTDRLAPIERFVKLPSGDIRYFLDPLSVRDMSSGHAKQFNPGFGLGLLAVLASRPPELSTSYHSVGLASSGTTDRNGNIFLANYVLRSRCYSTTDGSILSDTEKDRGNSIHRGGGKDIPPERKKVGIQELIPKMLWPYVQLARLDRPIGAWLLAWPCFWSICLAAPSGALPDLAMLGWFGLGALLLRGAGCTVNDLLDRDIDKKVERTQNRPIASGTLTPFQGVSFLGCQLLLGLGVLLQLNDFSRILGASSLLLVATYPFMKKWTFWPQAYLGLTFNWGALLGWSAIHGNIDVSVVLPLYASGVCWTLIYDTIYAHQDKDDDAKLGVKSTALKFGQRTQTWLTGFSAVCVIGLTLAGFNAGLGWPFYVGMAATTGHLAWQVLSVKTDDREDCNHKFVSNQWLGAIVCSGFVSGKLTALPLG